MTGILAGIRVLDMTRHLAGPWSAQMLGDLGAEIIKVERPGAGDDVRSFGPPFVRNKEGQETREAPFFFAANRNKKSITLNIAAPEGQDVIKSLVPHCDIVMENYKVGTLGRYGLGYEDLSKIKTDIIYCSITGFGQDGPYRDWAGYDSIFQALGGSMSVTGLPDGEPGGGPLRNGLAIADISAGMYASIAILSALYHQSKTGEGQYIDLALLDSQVAAMSVENLRYLLLGEVPQRTGNTSRNLVPNQVFNCSDGLITLNVGNDSQFEKFASLIGRSELAADERFKTGAARRKNKHELLPTLERLFLTRPVREWVNLLAPAGVPCAPINNIKEVFEDPQVAHREMRIEVEHESIGPVCLVANPIRFSRTPVSYRSAPPLLGRDTRDVLRTIAGLDDIQIDTLSKKGVIET